MFRCPNGVMNSSPSSVSPLKYSITALTLILKNQTDALVPNVIFSLICPPLSMKHVEVHEGE